MRQIKNEAPDIRPGDEIMLINGRNVKLVGRESYDWTSSEVVDRIEGETIIFRFCPNDKHFNIHMPWNIIKRGIQ